MTSRFLFKIGPIPVTQGFVNAFFVFPAKEDMATFTGGDDRSGLTRVVESYDPAVLECESDLSASAAEFGIKTGEVTTERAYMIGLMGFKLALPGLFDEVEREGALYQLGLACAKFWKAKPWREPYAGRAIQFSFEGHSNDSFEGIVLSGESKHGLMLYPRPGSLALVERLAASGQQEQAARVDALGVSFRDEPSFAIRAMEKAYGLRTLPVPISMKDGGVAVLKDIDLLKLSAALVAAAGLRNAPNRVGGEVTEEGVRIRAIATVDGEGKNSEASA